jgi:hypothetical protein
MSRGWESKDVESQQAERDWGERPAAPPTEREQRRQSLELSLTAARRSWRRPNIPDTRRC